jgi:hypothetical protein
MLLKKCLEIEASASSHFQKSLLYFAVDVVIFFQIIMLEFGPKSQFALLIISAISAFTSYSETVELQKDVKELVECVYAYNTIQETGLLQDIENEI